jgi:single-stranded DNA-binding protein
MEIKAKLLEIFESQQVTDTFKKREFVVEYGENPQYPEFLKFELIQDKCELLDEFSKGQKIEVHFNLKGRKWTDPTGVIKYFNTLQAWRILAEGSKPTAQPPINEPTDLYDSKPTQKSTINAWPPPEFSSEEKTNPSIADDPFTEDKLPF